MHNIITEDVTGLLQ